MADPLTDRTARTDINPALPPTQPDRVTITAADYRENFGEELRNVLDVGSWLPGDIRKEYDRIRREVHDAVHQERAMQGLIRARIFPLLNDPAIAPRGGGVFRANLDLLARIHAGLLFNGGVEACDGTVLVHDTLPLTIYQIGVSLVSYRGDEGTWCQRLFRRDLRHKGDDLIGEVEELLRRRSRREALNRAAARDALGELARRATMSYGERAILLRRSKAVWRMGHGNPIPYELLTGAGCFELMVASLTMLRELIEKHQKFVFVSSEPRECLLLTVGEALGPMQYAIVGTLRERLESWLHQDRFAVGVSQEVEWDGEPLKARQWIPRFLERVASKVVIGVYRATLLAPAQVFYAHEDHADLAAHIALADSALQEHRGFPLLLDLAHHVCHAVFGGTLQSVTEAAYASAGEPWRYFSERTTRDH
jgi:hypothetical protein